MPLRLHLGEAPEAQVVEQWSVAQIKISFESAKKLNLHAYCHPGFACQTFAPSRANGAVRVIRGAQVVRSIRQPYLLGTRPMVPA
jgi:hypothetical protein